LYFFATSGTSAALEFTAKDKLARTTALTKIDFMTPPEEV